MLHAAARLRQKTRQRVGHHSPPSVLPFGTNMHIKRRSWDRRKGRWSSKTLVGRVVCPSSGVVKGHLVLLENGEIVITSALVIEVRADSAESFHVDDPGDVRPATNRRITAKRARAPSRPARRRIRGTQRVAKLGLQLSELQLLENAACDHVRNFEIVAALAFVSDFP